MDSFQQKLQSLLTERVVPCLADQNNHDEACRRGVRNWFKEMRAKLSGGQEIATELAAA